MSTISSLQPPAWLPRSARSYTRPAQLWQIPTFLLGIVAIALVAANAALHDGRQAQAIEAEIRHIRALLQSPQVTTKTVIPRIEKLLDRASLSSQKAGEAHMLMAVALLHKADSGPPQAGGALLKDALLHLEEANVLGVVPENRPRLWYRLGKTLFRTGGDLKQAISYLQRSLPGGADDPAEGYGMLVEAYLRLPKPDLDAALIANRQQLNVTRNAKEQMAAYLQRGDLFMRKKQNFDALKVLERIGPSAPPELRRQAVYLRATACETEGLWGQAAPLWQELLKTPGQIPGGRKRILFTLGRCYHNATPPNEQQAMWAWSEAQNEGGAEGQAASLRLAEMYLFGNQRNFDLAVQQMAKALRDVKAPADYHNPLISLNEAKDLVAVCIRVATEAQAFAQAQQMADWYAKLSSSKSAELLLAEIAESWAGQLHKQAHTSDGAKAENLQKRAQAQWHKAAEAFHQAAGQQQEDKKADLLWRSARDYQKAGDAVNARDVLRQYVALSLPMKRLAEGWYALAEAQQALGQRGEARQSFYKCIEYPSSPCVYKARYRLALEKIAEKQFDQAETILRQNIPITSDLVDREAHEKSLYRLATLLFERNKFSDAYFYLEKAIRDYPDNPQAYSVRDKLGECYRMYAKQEIDKLKELVNPPPHQKQAILQSQQEWLEKAAVVYQQLADDLELKREQRRSQSVSPPLTPVEEGLFRKASFAAADLKFEMNLFTEAVRRYQLLARRYHGQLEELFACQRIYCCVTALKYQPKELEIAAESLRAALQSARETLSRLPEQKFHGTKSRQEWQHMFQSIQYELRQLTSSIEQPTSEIVAPAPPAAGAIVPGPSSSAGINVPPPAPPMHEPELPAAPTR